MIQFNLLPDIKLEYIKARRLKRTVSVISGLVSAVSLAVFILLFIIVSVVQKNHLNNLNDDIAANKKELQEKPQLGKIITVQNQLNSLPALHNQKPVASRIFTFVQQLTPPNVSISNLLINFDEQSMEIQGTADSLGTVNTYVDTLKFTNYSLDDQTSTQPQIAFNGVVLSEFDFSTADKSDKSKPASYKISFKYNPAIFSSDGNVKLVVPSQVTTRSETQKPSSVFQNNIKPTE
jgi:Tfp pilus assembly protein PilN